MKSAPEVMHKAIEGVECYIDDILVWGKDQAEHDERFRKVLQKCREEKPSKRTNAKSQPTVKFIGHELSKGLAPSRDRVQSVVEMTTPQRRMYKGSSDLRHT